MYSKLTVPTVLRKEADIWSSRRVSRKVPGGGTTRKVGWATLNRRSGETGKKQKEFCFVKGSQTSFQGRAN